MIFRTRKNLRVTYRAIADDFGCLDISGCLDEDSAEQIRIEVAAAIRLGVVKLALNFSDVSFVDSSGLRAVVFVSAMLVRAGGGLFIVGLPKPILMVFSMTGLASILRIFADEADMLNHVMGTARQPSDMTVVEAPVG